MHGTTVNIVVFILPSLCYLPVPNGQYTAQDDVLRLLYKYKLPSRILAATDV